MHDTLARSIFALLCLVGAVAIATGAILELMRIRRGDSLVTAPQLRLRLVSACVWMMVLGATGYTLFFLWPGHHQGVRPTPLEIDQDRHFARGILAILAPLLVGLGLLIYDLYNLSRQRRVEEARFKAQLATMAQQEIDRALHRDGDPAQLEKTPSSTGGLPR